MIIIPIIPYKIIPLTNKTATLITKFNLSFKTINSKKPDLLLFLLTKIPKIIIIINSIIQSKISRNFLKTERTKNITATISRIIIWKILKKISPPLTISKIFLSLLLTTNSLQPIPNKPIIFLIFTIKIIKKIAMAKTITLYKDLNPCTTYNRKW